MILYWTIIANDGGIEKYKWNLKYWDHVPITNVFIPLSDMKYEIYTCVPSKHINLLHLFNIYVLTADL